MQSSNPVFKRGYAAIENRGGTIVDPSTDDLNNLYNAPAASSIRTGRMTIDDVVARTALLFVVLAGVVSIRLSLPFHLSLSSRICLVSYLVCQGKFLRAYLGHADVQHPQRRHVAQLAAVERHMAEYGVLVTAAPGGGYRVALTTEKESPEGQFTQAVCTP